MDTSLPENKLQCARCKNHIKFKKCKAFSGDIPEAILDGKHDHREPYPGDHGIQFEPKKGLEI